MVRFAREATRKIVDVSQRFTYRVFLEHIGPWESIATFTSDRLVKTPITR